MLRSFPLEFHKRRFFASYVSNNILLYYTEIKSSIMTSTSISWISMGLKIKRIHLIRSR